MQQIVRDTYTQTDRQIDGLMVERHSDRIDVQIDAYITIKIEIRPWCPKKDQNMGKIEY